MKTMSYRHVSLDLMYTLLIQSSKRKQMRELETKIAAIKDATGLVVLHV